MQQLRGAAIAATIHAETHTWLLQSIPKAALSACRMLGAKQAGQHRPGQPVARQEGAGQARMDDVRLFPNASVATAPSSQGASVVGSTPVEQAV